MRSGTGIERVRLLLLSVALSAVTTNCELTENADDIYQQNYLTVANAALLKQTCENNASPLNTFPTCGALLKHRDGGAGSGYEKGANPVAIPCGNEYGDVWAPDYQLASCCTGDGRYFVMTGQTASFDFGYATPTPDASCVAYAAALQAIVCSPQQGKHIVDGNLRVCKDACDAVFKACGQPGVNLPDSVSYTDGESLCKQVWGGFGYDNTNTCGRPGSYFCDEKIGIEVVNSTDATDCLSLIRPNYDLSNAEEYDYLENKYCPTSDDPNIDLDNPCEDIIYALNLQQGGTTQRRADEEECFIPMYARNEESRKLAMEKGCFSGASQKSASVTLALALALAPLLV